MRARYTQRAGRQLDAILAYTQDQSPRASVKLAERISELVSLLISHPFAGARTDVTGQRRLTISPHPYVLYYRVVGDDIVIQRIRHTSRRPV